MRKKLGWSMEEQDARSILRLIDERITSSNIEVAHRDALIRLASMIEDDLADLDQNSGLLVGPEAAKFNDAA